MKKFAIVLAAAAILSSTAFAAKKKVVINGPEDLVGKTIGVQAGTTGEMYAEEIEGAKVKSYKTGIEAGMALANGAIDAIILDELPSKEIVKRNSKKLKILPAEYATETYAIAVKKGNTELLNSINKTIAAMRKDGRYEALINAFMPADGEIKIPSLKGLDVKDTVKMGTNAAFPPFEYMEGSEVVGFDATMSLYIANDFGKKLIIQDMAFDSLIAAVNSGAIDFVAAGMTATEERAKYVDFSEPYFESRQVIIIRK